jgi:hypothetical protein
VSLVLVLLWAQDIYRKSASTGDTRETPVYLRWWVALGAIVVGVAAIALVGEQEEFGPLAALHNGELVAADYWADEPLILSADMGFDNIIGLEEAVREAGGSWYGPPTRAHRLQMPLHSSSKASPSMTTAFPPHSPGVEAGRRSPTSARRHRERPRAVNIGSASASSDDAKRRRLPR